MALWPRLSLFIGQSLCFLSIFSLSVATSTPHTESLAYGQRQRHMTRSFSLSVLSFGSLLRSTIFRFYRRIISGRLGIWDLAAFLIACGIIQAFRRRRRLIRERQEKSGPMIGNSVGKQRGLDESSIYADPGLLKKHSTFKSYRTSIATYRSIRTFYRPHPQADKLPSKPKPLPLLVFIHGLGGSLAQFHPLLTSLVNVAPCFGIDLPGCGLSDFSPQSWDAYTVEALTELLSVVITQHCNHEAGQEVILVGHSMGCSLSTLLASSKSLYHAKLAFEVIGQISICPTASVPSPQQVRTFRKLLNVPTPIFDLWRRWDRRGGPESVSVSRFVGRNADMETKKLQEKFNAQSQTPVWRRMAWGALPDIEVEKSKARGLPGPEIWSGLSLPLFLIAGEADTVTKPEELKTISASLGKIGKFPAHGTTGSTIIPLVAEPEPMINEEQRSESSNQNISGRSGLSQAEVSTLTRDNSTTFSVDAAKQTRAGQRRNVLKTSILPAPASHGLLYDNANYRTLAGLIQDFLADYVDKRLSLGWQLQLLSTEGKWDVKNLAKWQAVVPVSEPIATIFQAMKTLREIDECHSPAVFVTEWQGKIKAVIDISHESPVYDSKGLDSGGIEYHKFPTVSKIPPTTEEVKEFIVLVDRLRTTTSNQDHRLIGVHCHYGFNRTGFFICSYLIEKAGYGVQQAIDEFQARRPPGIRHEHFIDTLFVRYCVGLKRAPTS